MAYDQITEPLRGIEAKPGSGHYGVYDHGAHAFAWQPDKAAHPVLWMSTKSDLREGQPIRGGVPICFPWFAKGPDGTQTPQHGFARLDSWHRVDVKDTLDADGRLIVEHELNSSMDAEGFPHAYTVNSRTKFTPGYLQIAVTVTNEGTEAFTYELALHTYLAVGDITTTRIEGLDGVPYFDKVTGEAKTQAGDVVFTGETDRIYASDGTVIVRDPAWSRALEISKQGSANTVVWNPWAAKAVAMADFDDDEWTGMLCIEAANVLDNAITLAPGESHLLRQRVTLLGARDAS